MGHVITDHDQVWGSLKVINNSTPNLRPIPKLRHQISKPLGWNHQSENPRFSLTSLLSAEASLTSMLELQNRVLTFIKNLVGGFIFNFPYGRWNEVQR